MLKIVKDLDKIHGRGFLITSHLNLIEQHTKCKDIIKIHTYNNIHNLHHDITNRQAYGLIITIMWYSELGGQQTCLEHSSLIRSENFKQALSEPNYYPSEGSEARSEPECL